MANGSAFVSVALLSADEAENCALSYEGVIEAGSMLGCASVIVMDETTDIVHQVTRMASFYAHESCGLVHDDHGCTPQHRSGLDHPFM